MAPARVLARARVGLGVRGNLGHQADVGPVPAAHPDPAVARGIHVQQAAARERFFAGFTVDRAGPVAEERSRQPVGL